MTRSPDRSLRIATRGSRLARTQAELVTAALRKHHPNLEVELVIVSTRGDKDQRPFSAIGGKGLFMAEVEREVVEGRADIAVHSAKDLTAVLHPEAAIVCIAERGPVHDVVVGGRGGSGEERLASLPPGARVGTSSVRRRALLSDMRTDLEVVDLRGNVDTRLQKVADGVVEVAILAAAGLQRLGVEVDAAPLDEGSWVPAPAQGALALEARSDREDLAALLDVLEDPVAHAEVSAERAFAARLEGGCTIPLGCLARVTGERLVATGFLGHPEGSSSRRDRLSGPAADALRLGEDLADAILQAGGDELLEELRAESVPEVPAP